MIENLETWKFVVQLIEAAVTIGAVLVGGYWTYTTFVRERIGFSKLEIVPKIDMFDIGSDGRLMHIEVALSNIGRTKIEGESAELRIRQVIPPPDQIRGLVRSNTNVAKAGHTEVEWPCIAQRDWTWEEGQFEIEPGESDSLHADIGILSDVAVIQLYLFIKNRQKVSQDVGWSITSIHRIDSEAMR